MQVHIINFPQTRIAALEHHGPESQTYSTTMKFIEWRQQNRIGPDQGNTYGIHYTDPKNTFPEDFRLDICVSVEDEIDPDNPQGVINKTIPACRCAVARHKGSREHVSAADYLVYDWLPQSGEEMGDFPIFFSLPERRTGCAGACHDYGCIPASEVEVGRKRHVVPSSGGFDGEFDTGIQDTGR